MVGFTAKEVVTRRYISFVFREMLLETEDFLYDEESAHNRTKMLCGACAVTECKMFSSGMDMKKQCMIPENATYGNRANLTSKEKMT